MLNINTLLAKRENSRLATQCIFNYETPYSNFQIYTQEALIVPDRNIIGQNETVTVVCVMNHKTVF